MKKILFVFFACLITTVGFGQDITGKWQGVLNVQGSHLRLLFTINKSDSGYVSTMTSMDQNAITVPVKSTSFANDTLQLNVSSINAKYKGQVKNDSAIAGTYTQNGRSFELNLLKGTSEPVAKKRPQEPTKPYPYYSEEVRFTNNKANISLAGTLTLPQKDGVFPVVVLITGSGPQDRNEELMRHKPFLVISDYLTRNGVAVLRYDDRGFGESQGNFQTATTVDFATDVQAAVDYLKTRKEINKKKIGLIGHSEGGIVAPLVASKSKDVAFIVLLAGPGIPGDQLSLLQSGLLAKAVGASEADIKEANTINSKCFEIIKNAKDSAQLKRNLADYLNVAMGEGKDTPQIKGVPVDDTVLALVDQLSSPWMQYFLKYDPAPALQKVTCPVLALNGSKDIQVPAKVDLEGISKALAKGGNKNVTIKELPNLNHLFQECKTCTMDEYAIIEQTFSPLALAEVLNWIVIQTR
ncbi:alpha/beta hydrolase family protein [Pinibacter soli]|uniref:Alpha/beta hydrolase n=1 Tax=Pinibacter soli TaxID=3044211 RepID=A0ABT6RBF6_9BACT|nr:alpha/beta hydrolase [Pinibacter soli]MDI3319232.1 alpha/beta hydrolase [Pinibacter soli]